MEAVEERGRENETGEEGYVEKGEWCGSGKCQCCVSWA